MNVKKIYLPLPFREFGGVVKREEVGAMVGCVFYTL
jgi:hypothetical protein